MIITDAVLIALVGFVLLRLELVMYKLGKLEGRLEALWKLNGGQTDGQPGDES